MTRIANGLLRWSLPIALGLVPVAALAATADQKSTAGELQEVTVTAERFSSNLQTTPIAISAFSADALEQHQISNVLEASAQIPGIMMTPTTGATSGARIFMRGVGDENTAILFDPAVGVYVDGIYQPRINGQFFDFFDIDRLEVLRGPQGTLYGRNSSGGAIKIESRAPSFTWTAAGDVAFGNYSQTDARVYLSGPLVADQLAGSISAVSRKRDGWTYDANYDRPLNNRDQQGMRAKLLYTPTDKFSAQLAFMMLKDRSDAGLGSQISLLFVPGVAVPNPHAVPGRDLFTSELSGPQFNQGDIDGASLNMSYKLTPTVTLNSITGWGFQKVNLATVYAQTTIGSMLGTSYRFTDDFFSEEANATATFEHFKGVAGAYYFTESGHEFDGPPYTATLSQNYRDRKTDAWALFTQGTYYVTDQLGLTVGLRYTSEKADITQFYINRTALAPLPQSATKTFTATTPKFGIDYQLLPNLLAYASVTKGFKSGGFNVVSPATNIGGPPGTVAGPTPYGQEDVTSYEAGVKFQSQDHHVRVNVAVFQADYDGLQLPVFFPGTTNSYTYNATGARVRGIEIEPTWAVNDTLQISAMGSFEDDKYTKPFNCSLYNTTIVNCQGNKLKGVIPAKTSLSVEYSPKLAIEGSLHLSADWEHNGAYYNNVSNTLPIIQTPKADLLNASFWWDSADEHWRLSLEGKNITNKQYALESLQIASAVQPSITVYPNDPRTYDLRFRFKF